MRVLLCVTVPAFCFFAAAALSQLAVAETLPGPCGGVDGLVRVVAPLRSAVKSRRIKRESACAKPTLAAPNAIVHSRTRRVRTGTHRNSCRCAARCARRQNE